MRCQGALDRGFLIALVAIIGWTTFPDPSPPTQESAASSVQHAHGRSDATPGWQQVTDRPDPRRRAGAAHLPAQAWGESVGSVTEDLDQDTVRWLADIATSDTDPGHRREAVLQLAVLDGDAALDALAMGLGDTDVFVRTSVVEALAARGEAALHLLGQVLFGDPEPALRLRVVNLIGEIDGPVVRALLSAATADPHPDVRNRAESWLAALPWWPPETHAVDTDLQADSIAPEVVEQLLSPNASERVAAIAAVVASGSPDGVALLGHMLETDADLAVRREAMEGIAALEDPQAVTALGIGLGDQASEIRSRAMQLLAERVSEPVPMLGQVLLADPDPQLRRLAVLRLARLYSPAARAMLAVAVQDADQQVREAAVAAL